MIIIGRPINGISLNGLEYLMTKNGKKEKEFKDKESAKKFLRKNGHADWTDDELEDSYMFVDTEENSEKKSCDNCGSTNGYNNSSDEFQCENCGHSETE